MTRHLRILIVANVPPYETGGAETRARQLAEIFLSRGHDVHIAGQRVPETRLNTPAGSLDLLHIRTLNKGRLLLALSYALSLAWILIRNRNKLDVVYCRYVREAAVVSSLVKLAFRLPFALIPCTADTGPGGDACFLSQLPATRWLAQKINKACDAINNISPATAQELTGVGIDPGLFTYIPNGVRIPASPRRDRVLQPCRFVFLGRLEIYKKGLDTIVDAFEGLVHDGYNAQLRIIGGGSDEATLRRTVDDRGLSSRIEFTGFVPNSQIAAALKDADIFVMASRHEGFATVVVEAMASGLPVIATRCGGPEFIVERQFGRLCPPDSVDCLRATMKELLSAPPDVLTDMGQHARETARAQYSVDTVAQRYLNLFAEKAARYASSDS